MDKSLFLTFQFIKENDGISRKIINEFSSLNKNGFNMDLGSISLINRGISFQINGEPIITYCRSPRFWKILCRLRWRKLYRRIIAEGYKFIYVRYTHFASPWIVKLFRKLHDKGIVIFLEIPTYPYDQEYINRKGILDKIGLIVEKKYRTQLALSVDRIITFSNDDIIWSRPTIKIANAVNINDIPLWSRVNDQSKCFRMIGVAAFSEWHGYDRLLRGIANYVHNGNNVDIHLSLVGPENETRLKLQELTTELNISKYVSFLGSMSGKTLDEEFNHSDLAIGSLGRHRSGTTKIRTLKNREYAARGIPFIYSESDPDFDDKDYSLHIPADESDVSIPDLIKFITESKFDPENARNFVTSFLTWDFQMKIVKDSYLNLL